MIGHDKPDLPGAGSPQDITDPATGGSRLLSARCSTCILRPGDPMHLGPERLREIIGPALAAGSFVVCHDTLTYGISGLRPRDLPGLLRRLRRALTRADIPPGLAPSRRGAATEAADPGPAAAGPAPGRSRTTLPAARQAAPRPAGSPHDHHQDACHDSNWRATA
jgi:hypothetical protein